MTPVTGGMLCGLGVIFGILYQEIVDEYLDARRFPSNAGSCRDDSYAFGDPVQCTLTLHVPSCIFVSTHAASARRVILLQTQSDALCCT
jgi:hypothetical protein